MSCLLSHIAISFQSCLCLFSQLYRRLLLIFFVQRSMKIDDEVQQAEDAAKKPEEEATMSAPSTGGVLWTLLGRKTDPKKESVPKKAPKEETSVAVQPQRGYHVLARKEDSALLVPHSTAAAKTVIIVEKHEQPKPEEPQLESKKAPLATGAEAAKTVRILEEPQAFSSPLADEEKDNGKLCLLLNIFLVYLHRSLSFLFVCSNYRQQRKRDRGRTKEGRKSWQSFGGGSGPGEGSW